MSAAKKAPPRHPPLEQVFGASDAVSTAWTNAGRPHDFHTFSAGYEAGREAAQARATAGPVELVTELRFAGQLLHVAHKQMSFQQKAAYARNAHNKGLIGADELRDSERAAVLQRFGGAEA